MKNSFKISLVALTTAVSFAACSGNKSGGSSDSTKVDSSSSMKSTSDTTIKSDSLVARDTNTVKPGASDTTKAAMKPDTMKKTVTHTTVVKKTVVKKP